MKNTLYPNVVEFEVSGDYALFTDPITKVGGEKCSYQIPTYEALKGILHSIYWKPTFIWFIDEVRIMDPIQMVSKEVRTTKYFESGADLSYYTYLRKCRYQVRAHFEWNENRPEFIADRNENKHHQIALRMIDKGGRRDIFLGSRECQGYVEPCAFGSGTGFYDNIPEISFGQMYHGITYADEAYDDATRDCMTKHFWIPVMKYGIIKFQRPEECPMHQKLHDMSIKQFGSGLNNFSGLSEFKEEI